MLSYGLRLNAALIPFLLPVLVLVVVVLFLTGHRADAAWFSAIAALELLGYGITRFWLCTIEEQDAREWQRRIREDNDLE